MTIDEQIKANPGLRSLIDLIASHKSFLALKDAFVSYTPAGDKNIPTNTKVSHGMYLGTRFVFNEMERIYREPKTDTKTKEKKQPVEVDPDLQD